MLVTDAVFHELMSWLNASALWNILYMFVTEAVFHEPMSSLKVLLSSNICDMSVMRTVSQFQMGPYDVLALVGSLTHRFTAVRRTPLLVNDVGQEAEPGLLWNIMSVCDTPVRSQHRYWSKAEASLNIQFMFVPEWMLQELRSWLKAEAE